MYFCEAKIWDFEWKGLISRHTDRSPRLTAKNGALSRLVKWRCRSGRLSIYHLSPCSNPPLIPRPLPSFVSPVPSASCVISTQLLPKGGAPCTAPKNTPQQRHGYLPNSTPYWAASLQSEAKNPSFGILYFSLFCSGQQTRTFFSLQYVVSMEGSGFKMVGRLFLAKVVSGAGKKGWRRFEGPS